MQTLFDQMRVLVADPSSHMATLVAQMLHTLRIRTVDASVDIDRTMAELGRRQFDLVLIDEQLAGKSGFDAIRALRQSAEHPNRATPIIMMASAPDARMITAARDAGVSEFLRKPFSAEHIRLRIEGLKKVPRAFVEATDYAGPDRRRKAVPGKGKRRAGEAAG